MRSSSGKEFRVRQGKKIATEFTVPGDKSITHRALMLAGIANGECELSGLLTSEDCMATLKAMRALGVEIEELETDQTGHPCRVRVHGLSGKLKAPEKDIDCGNSGTTMRLMAGLLAAQPFESVLFGDDSLSRRPMKRVIEPLELMGATLKAEGEPGCAPINSSGSITRLS